MMENIPCYLHPCKVMFVDDNTHFLSQIPASLDSNNSYIYESDPRKALDYLNSHTPSPSALDDLLQGNLNDNIEKLYKEVYNPHRFDRVSTVVADYDMPELTGIEFLKQIKDPHIQKILLTGAADENIAIEAFNKGHIHYYIKKSGNQTYQNLNNYIAACNAKYFYSFSQTYLETLKSLHISTLEDKFFAQFFSEFIKEHNIVEFYLKDFSGTFLCLDAYARPSVLFIFNEEMLTYQDEEVEELIRENYDKESVTRELIGDLKNHRKGLCFDYTEEKPVLSPDEWTKYVYPLNKLEGEKQTYYWSYLPVHPTLTTDSLVSFEQFNIQILNSLKNH